MKVRLLQYSLLSAIFGGALLLGSSPASLAQGAPAGWAAVGPGSYAIEENDPAEMGFRDGRRAAHDDMNAGRRPEFKHHEEFRHPPVPRRAAGAYRDGFRRGYSDGVEHELHRR